MTTELRAHASYYLRQRRSRLGMPVQTAMTWRTTTVRRHATAHVTPVTWARVHQHLCSLSRLQGYWCIIFTLADDTRADEADHVGPVHSYDELHEGTTEDPDNPHGASTTTVPLCCCWRDRPRDFGRVDEGVLNVLTASRGCRDVGTPRFLPGKCTTTNCTRARRRTRTTRPAPTLPQFRCAAVDATARVTPVPWTRVC